MRTVQDKVKQGWVFEKAIVDSLRSLAEQEGWLILEDVKLASTSETGYTQIDIILFTPYRYFCIEAKDWNGVVICSDKQYWTVNYGRIIKTLSPVQQNLNHITKLSRLITPYKIESAVCFSEFTEIVDIVQGVYRMSDFFEYVKKKSREFSVITKEEMLEDYNTVLKESTTVKLDELIREGTLVGLF